MSALSISILTTFVIVLALFRTRRMATAYTRDRLTSLRNNRVLLNHRLCLQVSQLGLRQRGCRAGAHHRYSQQAAHNVTTSVSRPRTPGEIPVITGHQTVFTNNDVTHVRLYCSRRLSASMHISRRPQLRQRV